MNKLWIFAFFLANTGCLDTALDSPGTGPDTDMSNNASNNDIGMSNGSSNNATNSSNNATNGETNNVTCTPENAEKTCGDRVCNPFELTCTSLKVNSLTTCEECTWSAECGENSFCVDDKDGRFCVPKPSASGKCELPFQFNRVDTPEISEDAGCGADLGRVCEEYGSINKPCSEDSECDGLDCSLSNPRVCSYPCDEADICPSYMTCDSKFCRRSVP